jgi:hypothetical protein
MNRNIYIFIEKLKLYKMRNGIQLISLCIIVNKKTWSDVQSMACLGQVKCCDAVKYFFTWHNMMCQKNKWKHIIYDNNCEDTHG